MSAFASSSRSVLASSLIRPVARLVGPKQMIRNRPNVRCLSTQPSCLTAKVRLNSQDHRYRSLHTSSGGVRGVSRIAEADADSCAARRGDKTRTRDGVSARRPTTGSPSYYTASLRSLELSMWRTTSLTCLSIKVHFLKSDSSPLKTIECNEGDDLLSLAHEHDVDLEGACEGSVACSTCHVVLDGESYDKLPEAEDEENDMLDLAFGLEDT